LEVKLRLKYPRIWQFFSRNGDLKIGVSVRLKVEVGHVNVEVVWTLLIVGEVAVPPSSAPS
jgi:hypothetical protein